MNDFPKPPPPFPRFNLDNFHRSMSPEALANERAKERANKKFDERLRDIERLWPKLKK